jgi:hypothetical protein
MIPMFLFNDATAVTGIWQGDVSYFRVVAFKEGHH